LTDFNRLTDAVRNITYPEYNSPLCLNHIATVPLQCTYFLKISFGFD